MSFLCLKPSGGFLILRINSGIFSPWPARAGPGSPYLTASFPTSLARSDFLLFFEQVMVAHLRPWALAIFLSWHPFSAWLSPSFHSDLFKFQLLREDFQEHVIQYSVPCHSPFP